MATIFLPNNKRSGTFCLAKWPIVVFARRLHSNYKRLNCIVLKNVIIFRRVQSRNTLLLFAPIFRSQEVAKKILQKALTGLNWGFQTLDESHRLYFEDTNLSFVGEIRKKSEQLSEKEGLKIVFKEYIDSVLNYLTIKRPEKKSLKSIEDETHLGSFKHLFVMEFKKILSSISKYLRIKGCC